MINKPIQVIADGFQSAWLEALQLLMASSWEFFNLIVQIKDPTIWNQAFHDKIETFTKVQGLIGQKHVAYTIFPHKLYKRKRHSIELFEAYNRPRGLFDRTKTRWGTYFRRMTNYEVGFKTINQLANIISAINNRNRRYRTAYTIIIPRPGRETVQPLGGPCLNYIAVQAEPEQRGQSMILGMLAVYRNHDFLTRAYGNYWGLCNLLKFIAKEANGIPGPLTCVSSHAYVSGKKIALKRLMEDMQCNVANPSSV